MHPIYLVFGVGAAMSEWRTTATAPPPTLSRDWSGVKQSGNGFTSVTGTVRIPTGGEGFGPSIWVGIDGSSECQGGGLLQTGVRLTGNGSAFAWFEWVPLDAPVFDNFSVSAGHIVKMTVIAYGPTNGSAILDNLTTGQSVSHTFTSDETPANAPLCQKSAEWIVEDYNNDGNDTGIVASPDYGSITFYDASAQNAAGEITPAAGELIELFDTSTGAVLSKCSPKDESITCQYVGPRQ